MPSTSGFHWTLAPFKPFLDDTSWMWRCYCPAVRYVYGDYVYSQFVSVSLILFEFMPAAVRINQSPCWQQWLLCIQLSLFGLASVSLICIGVHARCHLTQSKSLTPHFRSQCLLCVQLSLFGFALDLWVTFESWCDKYWMLYVNTLHATCLLDYMDSDCSLTLLTSD